MNTIFINRIKQWMTPYKDQLHTYLTQKVKKPSIVLISWFLWLFVQSIWSCLLKQWELGLIYFGFFLAFQRLIIEPTVKAFNDRLFFWMKVALVFSLGRFLITLYGMAGTFLFQEVLPSQVLKTILPLAIEIGFIPLLKQQQQVSPSKVSPEQKLLVDMETGEVLKKIN